MTDYEERTLNGIPIRPGCVIADVYCGDSCHCWQGAFCETHQDPNGNEDWPCEPQREYEETPEVQLDLLRQRLAKVEKALEMGLTAGLEHAKETARLTRIVEQLVVPFIREVAAEDGIQITIPHLGEAESLTGLDTLAGPGVPGQTMPVTFNCSKSASAVTLVNKWTGTEWKNGSKGNLS